MRFIAPDTGNFFMFLKNKIFDNPFQNVRMLKYISGACSSVEERHSYKVDVAGPIPATRTIILTLCFVLSSAF